MKDWDNESGLNAQLRELTAQLREVREELRSNLQEVPHSPRRTLDEHFQRIKARRARAAKKQGQ